MSEAPQESTSPKVFVSHAGEDKRFVEDFAAGLRENNIDAWVDSWELLPGDSIIDKIFEEAIGRAEAVIIVISEASVEKPWVREELNTSKAREIAGKLKIIPVVIDEAGEGKMPVSLQATLWQKVDPNDFGDALERVVGAVYGIRQRPPLGNPPEYTSNRIADIPGLSNTDTLLLKVCCELEIEADNGDSHLDTEDVLKKALEYDLSRSQAVDAIVILGEMGYLNLMYTNSLVPYRVKVRSEGFDVYGQNFMPEYEVLTQRVAAQIVNHEQGDSLRIARSLETPLVVVEHILRVFEQSGQITILSETGMTLHIGTTSPRLRRWLDQQDS